MTAYEFFMPLILLIVAGGGGVWLTRIETRRLDAKLARQQASRHPAE